MIRDAFDLRSDFVLPSDHFVVLLGAGVMRHRGEGQAVAQRKGLRL